MSLLTKAFIVLLSLVVIFNSYVQSTVLGIDLSAEFIKVAAVKSGNPFHIVIDEQAKRKVPVAVAFDDGERHFGNNAVGLAIRKPLDTFLWYHRLIGQTIDSPKVQQLRTIFPYEYVALPNRGNAVGIKSKSGYIYSPEELVAMSLQHVRKIVKDDDMGDAKEAVITVPAWFTQVERECIYEAANLAGLSILALVNDNAATAVTYGIDRTYTTNETHVAMFVDGGSAGLEVSVVKYSAAKAIGYGKNLKYTGQAEVLATSYDDSLGGLAFDTIVRDILIEDFISKYGDKVKDVRSNHRAMAKLLKQANTVKTILSANVEIPVKMESVYLDLDLHTSVSREKFYERAALLFSRLELPVADAVIKSGLELPQIDSVVIVGGTVRIPMIQQELKKLMQKETLAQNVNGDEAMAMGAVFRAANVSTSFQVRQFGLSDVLYYPIDLNINDLPEVTEEPLSRSVALFPSLEVLGKKKVVSVSHDKNLRLTLKNQLEFTTLSVVDITGVPEIIADPKYAQYIPEDKKVKIAVTIGLTESSLVVVNSADIVFEIPPTQAELDKHAATNSTKALKPKKLKVGLTATPLENDETFTIYENGFVPLNNKTRTAVSEVLTDLTAKDAARRAYAAARNTLEAQIYSIRNALYDDAFESVTTEEEREKLRAHSEEAEEWLYDALDDTPMEEYYTQYDNLSKDYNLALYRKNQIAARGNAIEVVTNAISKTRDQVVEWQIKRNWLVPHLTNITELVNEIETNMNELVSQQEVLELTVAPAFDADHLISSLKPLIKLVKKVEKIKAPKKKKVKKTSETNSTSNAEPQEEIKVDVNIDPETPNDTVPEEQTPTEDTETGTGSETTSDNENKDEL